jgi:pimeloyl-ACP methyl ester carboxylesterase
VGWLRRLPLLYGQMVRRPVPDELMRCWTEPVLTNPDIRRDLLTYARGPFDKAALVRDTEALRRFQGDVLVLWSPDNKVMPPAHGHRLAALLPRARYAEIPGAYVLSTLDDPEAVAREMSRFLTSTPATKRPSRELPHGSR